MAFLYAAIGVGGIAAAGIAHRLSRRSEAGLVLAVATVLCGLPMATLAARERAERRAGRPAGRGRRDDRRRRPGRDVAPTAARRGRARSRVRNPGRPDRGRDPRGRRPGADPGDHGRAPGRTPDRRRDHGPRRLAILVQARAIDRSIEANAEPLRDRVASLRRLAIFRGASRATLEHVAEVMREEPVDVGIAVVRQGDVPDDLFVVLAGTLLVSASTPDGEQPSRSSARASTSARSDSCGRSRGRDGPRDDALPSVPDPGARVPGDPVPRRRPVADPHACRAVPVGRVCRPARNGDGASGGSPDRPPTARW